MATGIYLQVSRLYIIIINILVDSTTSSSQKLTHTLVKMSEKAMLQIEENRMQNQRKSNKPLMEKKRRARINNCLTELKSLVLSAMKKDPTRFSKLEKADILEMTVQHLRNIQRHPVSMSKDVASSNKYTEGFNKCAGETIRYLDSSENTKEIDAQTRSRLSGHLSSCMTALRQQNKQNIQEQTVTSSLQQPLNIQIPSPTLRLMTPPPTASPEPNNQSLPVTLPSGQCAYLVVGNTNIVPVAQVSPSFVNGFGNALVVAAPIDNVHQVLRPIHQNDEQKTLNRSYTPPQTTVPNLVSVSPKTDSMWRPW
ncbi:unnamed protein product [Owenia fusiformis]|uniref:Uncharacterized protein n=1 Tax=Owenia fusiformis TaxID=6347 RepID=A0A8S4N0S0_OWEFU|nr:unnamed protein product [Owenia fusiformis]